MFTQLQCVLAHPKYNYPTDYLLFCLFTQKSNLWHLTHKNHLWHQTTTPSQATPVLSSSISTAAKAAVAPATEASGEGSNKAHYAAAMGGVFAGIFGAYTVASASEQGDGMHSPHYPWSHDGPLDSYDHGSMRRGHKVGGNFGLVSGVGHFVQPLVC